MIIQDVLTALKDATGPVIKLLIKGNSAKVIVLGFKKGMVLKEHKTGVNTKLVVVEGQISYLSVNGKIEMNRFDDLDIPINVPHSVEALADSICFLIQA